MYEKAACVYAGISERHGGPLILTRHAGRHQRRSQKKSYSLPGQKQYYPEMEVCTKEQRGEREAKEREQQRIKERKHS